MNFHDPKKQLEEIIAKTDKDGDGINDAHEQPVPGKNVNPVVRSRTEKILRNTKKILAGEKWKALSIVKSLIKPLVPSWIGKVADEIGDQLKDDTMAKSKGLTKSKTIITSIVVGVAGLLAILGVIPEEAVSPDAGWVATAVSVVMFALRLVTKDPVQVGGE